jgi:transposase
VKAAAQVTEPQDDEPARLASRVTSLEAEQRTREDRIRLLEEENAWLRARLWGRSSEKSPIEFSPDQWQLVFNEAEARTFEAAGKPAVADIAAHQRAKPGRRKLPANLERVPEVYDLLENEKVCPHDGTSLKVMGAAQVAAEKYRYPCTAGARGNHQVRGCRAAERSGPAVGAL